MEFAEKIEYFLNPSEVQIALFSSVTVSEFSFESRIKTFEIANAIIYGTLKLICY